MTELAPAAKATDSDFRGAMSKTCRELRICQQIANGSKHMKNKWADVSVGAAMKWEIVPNPNPAEGAPSRSYDWDLVVLDGGTERKALEVFDEVFRFWRRQLATWGFIEDWLVPDDETLAD